MTYKYQYISSNLELQQIVSMMMNAPLVSVDLEFDNNLHRYGFTLCLVQIAIRDYAYLIDPQKVDICLLFPVLVNPDIKKIVFSFGEDLRLLRSLGCHPKNVFDISTAVKLMNYERISLADVVDEQLGFLIEKGEQTSDWCRRPLSSEQMKYAAGDVVFLERVYEKVSTEIDSRGMGEWMEEEMIALDQMPDSESIANNLPTKHRRLMNEVEWHYFKRLWERREVFAKELNRPAYQVINGEFLVEIARKPELLNQWVSLKNMHHSLKTHSVMKEMLHLRKLIDHEVKELNLSVLKPALPPLEKEEYLKLKAQKKKTEFIKEKYLKPVHELIKRDFGEFAVNHILSNRIMDEIAGGNKENYREYRMKLVDKYLKELGLEWWND